MASADDKKAITDADITRTERAWGVLRGVFKGLKPDDITQVAEAFRAVGINLNKVNAKNMGNIVSTMERMGNEKLGTKAAETADKMIKSIDNMLQQQKVKNNDFVSAYLRRTEIELRLAKLAKEKIEAEAKGGIFLLQAMAKQQAAKIGAFAQKYMGASSGFTKSIIQMAGPIGMLVAVFMLASAASRIFHERMQKSTGALVQTGLATGLTMGKYNELAINIGAHLTSMTSLGFASETALKLWGQAVKDNIVSLGMLSVAQEGANVKDDASRVEAIKRAQDMTFEFGRMSIALTGSTESINQLIGIANKFNINSVKQIQLMGAGIANMAGRAGIQGNTVMDLWNTIGDSMIGLQGGSIGALQSLIPLTTALGKFREKAHLSEFVINDMAKGIINMTKGADSILYLALKGGRGKNLNERMTEAIHTDPLTKAMDSLQMLYNKTKGHQGIGVLSMALKDYMPGMNENQRLNMMDMFQRGLWTPKLSKQMAGMSQEEQMKKMLEISQGQGKKMSETAVYQAMGISIEEQALDILKKLLMSVMDMATGILSKLGMAQYMANITDIKRTSNQANVKPDSAYSSHTLTFVGTK
jgi:hypothetical protein